MEKKWSLSTRTATLIPIVAVVFGLILAVGVRSSNSSLGSKQRLREKHTQEEVSEALRSGRVNVQNLSIKNHTQSFNLLGSALSEDQDGVSLRLQNGYEKKITAFQLSFGIVTLKRELIYDEKDWIQPNQNITFKNEAEPELDSLGIEILAVVFDDGTSDGSEKAIKEIREYRSGMKTAIKEALPKLQKILSKQKGTLASAIEEVSFGISTLPEIPEPSLPYNTRVGIHDQRWRIVQELQMVSKDRRGLASLSLETKQDMQHTGLSGIVDRYKRIIAVL